MPFFFFFFFFASPNVILNFTLWMCWRDIGDWLDPSGNLIQSPISFILLLQPSTIYRINYGEMGVSMDCARPGCPLPRLEKSVHRSFFFFFLSTFSLCTFSFYSLFFFVLQRRHHYANYMWKIYLLSWESLLTPEIFH